MELTEVTNNANEYVVAGNFGINAGQKLKMEVGNDELGVVVPAGKHWGVRVHVRVEEVDA